MGGLTLMSWNVNGSGEGRAAPQLAEIEKLGPDVLALQEVIAGTLDFWRHGLTAGGYTVLSSDVELLKSQGPLLPHKGEGVRFGKRRNLNVIASRHPIEPLEGLPYPDPVEGFPEKYLVARVTVEGEPIDIHNAHTPPGVTVKMLKAYYWETMLERLAQPTDSARILCGDFNAPLYEDDVIVGYPPEKSEGRWEQAELGFLDHPELRDVYRANRVEGTRFPVSVTTGQTWLRRTPRRYDHIYVSDEFEMPRCRCEYLGEFMRWPETLIDAEGRSEGAPDSFQPLSDHAPALATLVLR